MPATPEWATELLRYIATGSREIVNMFGRRKGNPTTRTGAPGYRAARSPASRAVRPGLRAHIVALCDPGAGQLEKAARGE
jgi:hypothetical protein